ncbi:MAG: PHP domain-containing protein, partial [Gammaproteobacteria bacterium]|nr:PHP domain-containing protein [Gammaproteobacteria bacterium]
MDNLELSAIFYKIADLLEEQEDNPYRIKAYRRAAGNIKKYSKNIEQLVRNNIDLTTIPYIGIHLAEKIKQIIFEGEEVIYTKFQFVAPKKLKKKSYTYKVNKFRIYSIISIMEKIHAKLQTIDNIKKIIFVGDYRRKKEAIQDGAVVVSGIDNKALFNAILTFPYIKSILQKSSSAIKVQLKIGIPFTFYIANDESFGAKILYLTGVEAHYQSLKKIAENNDLKLNLKGLYKGRKKVAGSNEENIYKILGLQYIEPELRENNGEIITALENKLPQLITLQDIKGDLHSHTNETDGSFTLEEMVEAARSHGYEYVAITDHSQSLKITNGMDEKRLLKQIKQIDKLNEKYSDFVILKSMEIDILEDGSLDLSNDVLKELDLTVCSIHSKFRLSVEKQTERVLRAMDNPYFNILGHATGRLLTSRPPYAITMEKILNAAKERGCFIELN